MSDCKDLPYFDWGSEGEDVKVDSDDEDELDRKEEMATDDDEDAARADSDVEVRRLLCVK